jgi:hypothetical protein
LGGKDDWNDGGRSLMGICVSKNNELFREEAAAFDMWCFWVRGNIG